MIPLLPSSVPVVVTTVRSGGTVRGATRPSLLPAGSIGIALALSLRLSMSTSTGPHSGPRVCTHGMPACTPSSMMRRFGVLPQRASGLPSSMKPATLAIATPVFTGTLGSPIVVTFITLVGCFTNDLPFSRKVSGSRE